MGRGNICPTGENSSVYFIDYDFIEYYRNKSNTEDIRLRGEFNQEVPEGYEFDQDATDFYLEDMLSSFKESLVERNDSFTDAETVDNVILTNDYFNITIMDNEWSLAFRIEPIEYKGCDDSEEQEFYKEQSATFESIKTNVMASLFEQFEEICLYSSPWTSGKMTRKEFLLKTRLPENDVLFQCENKEEIKPFD